MKARRKKRGHFPFYLTPRPCDAIALAWLGKRLHVARGIKTIKAVAAAAKVPQDNIRAIEKGTIHLGLGQLRHITFHGYGTDFGDLLAECFEANREVFDPQKGRPFDRDYHYALTLHGDSVKGPTALLIGGTPDSFLWAIPMRRLKDQAMVTEYLELAPKRKRLSAGLTPGNTHEGSEVVFVMNGSVTVHISGRTGEADVSRTLARGDAIHFRAVHPHNIENAEPNTTALLLIVRLQGSSPKTS
jgi:mannose-6-phosphate isomerase-like protein (cupin superfamily)